MIKIKRVCSLEIPTYLVHYRVSSPQAFKRLQREHGTIKKREKWRQASRRTGDEAAPTALCGWCAKQDEKEDDATVRVSGNPFLSFFVVFISLRIKRDKPGVSGQSNVGYSNSPKTQWKVRKSNSMNINQLQLVSNKALRSNKLYICGFNFKHEYLKMSQREGKRALFCRRCRCYLFNFQWSIVTPKV